MLEAIGLTHAAAQEQYSAMSAVAHGESSASDSLSIQSERGMEYGISSQNAREIILTVSRVPIFPLLDFTAIYSPAHSERILKGGLEVNRRLGIVFPSA